jgi:hypothetical protein
MNSRNSRHSAGSAEKMSAGMGNALAEAVLRFETRQRTRYILHHCLIALSRHIAASVTLGQVHHSER